MRKLRFFFWFSVSSLHALVLVFAWFPHTASADPAQSLLQTTGKSFEGYKVFLEAQSFMPRKINYSELPRRAVK